MLVLDCTLLFLVSKAVSTDSRTTGRRRARLLDGLVPRLDQSPDKQRDIAGIRLEGVGFDDDTLWRRVSRGGDGGSGRDREKTLRCFYVWDIAS